MKIIPKLFGYVRLAGESSILTVKPSVNFIKDTKLILDSDKFVK